MTKTQRDAHRRLQEQHRNRLLDGPHHKYAFYTNDQLQGGVTLYRSPRHQDERGKLSATMLWMIGGRVINWGVDAF